MKNARFIDWCAAQFPTPDDVLAEFFDDAAAFAENMDATLDHLPVLDGRRHYLPNKDGKNDKKQFYLASIEQDRDGTIWPCVTFKNFKVGTGKLWKPRDLAWRMFENSRGIVAANDNARQNYQARAAEIKAAAEARAAASEAERNEGRKAAAAVAVAAWNAAEDCKVHPYLTRKNVAAYGLRVARQDERAKLWNDEASEWQTVPALRAGDLLVPLLDESGNLVNLQRIDANGKKRFIMGGRAHGCHYLIEGTTGRTVLAEGYATGATWREATGDSVALTFSAGSMPIVAGYIKADMVAADNDDSQTGEKAAKQTGLRYIMPPKAGQDWNDYAAIHGLEGIRAAVANDNAEAFKRPYSLPVVELAGREQTWWNKLQAAETPEATAAIAWAIGRRLIARVPVLMTLDGLTEQLSNAAPAGMMNPATLEAISEALGRIVEWRKRRALAGVAMSDEAIQAHNLETVEELPALTGDDYQGVLLVNSPMGSGKTQRIGRPFANWAKHQDARFVATCHRQSLVAELARVLVCDHYQETDGEFAWAVQAFATCLPSIVKDAHGQIYRETGYLFIDEIAQVLRSIASKVTVADKKTNADIFRALRDLVSRARCIIGADAGMDDRVLAFIESCRPGERFRIIQQPNRAEGLAVHFGFGPDALTTAYGEALARLAQGERLWVSCGEKSRAIEAARVLQSTGARVLLLHGDNRENAEQAEFWRNPEETCRLYDCVIHTGVISSGMSIQHEETGPYFTHGMMLASGATITPADAIQMLRRVRYLRTWTIAVTPNNAKDIDNADAILAGMEQAADLEGLTLKTCTDFDGFVAGIEADNARHRADFAAGLWWALERQGFDVRRMAAQGDAALAAELKATRADIRDERRAAILAAPDLTEIEAQRLRERPNRTEAEQFALLRHRIKSDLGINYLDDEALDVWDDGRGPRRMDRFSAATQRIAERTDHKGDDLALRRFSKARALAYAWLLEGIDLAPGLRITADLAQILISRVIERRYLLAYLGVVPAKWARYVGADNKGNPKPFPAPAYPVREVSDIFERMGLELKRRMNRIKSKMGHTYPDSPLEDYTPSVTQGRAIVATDTWHEITAESWERITRWADSRNSYRPVVAVAVEPANDTEYWLTFRRKLLADSGLTRKAAVTQLRTAIGNRAMTHDAKATVFWVNRVLPDLMAA